MKLKTTAIITDPTINARALGRSDFTPRRILSKLRDSGLNLYLALLAITRQRYLFHSIYEISPVKVYGILNETTSVLPVF
jgi:hypothetical protein